MSNRDVVIDPGHGGTSNIGGSSANNATGPNGTLEKNLTLDLARRTAALLRNNATVTLTRTGDTNLSLSDRAHVARDRGAAVFLSIHLNGFNDPSVDGTETWIAPGANAQSRRFAADVLRRVVAVTRVRDRGVRESNLGVLLPNRHAADTAVCLAEIAFLTNAAQEARLNTSAYCDRIAAALAEAVRAELALHAGTTAHALDRQYYKDDAALLAAPLAPPATITVDRSWHDAQRAAANTWNRLGGLISAVATRLNLEPATVLAVWYVESGGRSHTVNQAVIRFENHLLWRAWGQQNAAAYDAHFQHGGRAPATGDSCAHAWSCHKYRRADSGDFANVHRNQTSEYDALDVAIGLAGEPARNCLSIGGPQILISNYRRIGYASPRAMWDAFQAGERAQVLGFFDFCEGRLITALRNHDWTAFARGYNGGGQAQRYGTNIANAYAAAQAVLPSAAPPPAQAHAAAAMYG